MTTSTCDYLDDYIDGSLSPERIEQFDAHLADCTDCRDALHRQERLDALLDEAAICLEPVSAEFVESVKRNASRVTLLRIRRRWYLGVSAAAVLGFSILLSYVGSGRYGIPDREELAVVGSVEEGRDLAQESLTATQALALMFSDQPAGKRRVTPNWLDVHDDWGGQRLSRRPPSPKAIVLADEPSGPEATVQNDPVYGNPPFEARAIQKLQTFGGRRLTQYDEARLARLFKS